MIDDPSQDLASMPLAYLNVISSICVCLRYMFRNDTWFHTFLGKLVGETSVVSRSVFGEGQRWFSVVIVADYQ